MREEVGVDEIKVVWLDSPSQRRARTWRAAHPEHPQVIERSRPGQGSKVIREG